MPTVDLHVYRFSRRAHWACCGLDGFIDDGGALSVAASGTWQPVSTTAADRRPLALAYDGSGQLGWLRRSGELALWADGEITVLGRVAGAASACLAFSTHQIWLAAGGWLRVYDRLHLQELSAHRVGPVLALAVDRAGGVWCLVSAASDGCRWQYFDPFGRLKRCEVACPADVEVHAGALDPCSGRLVVVDQGAARSRGPCDPDWTTTIDLSPWRCCFEPDRIGIGCDHVIHLLDRRRRLLWSFTGHGVRAAKREVPADTETIAAGPTVALGGVYGILRWGEALATPTGTGGEANEAVLLTPTLISPREQGATWQRARIRAELPLGTALTVRVAASEDDGLAGRVAEIAARPALNQTQRLLALDGLLPWDPTFETALAAADDPLNRGWFDVVLDGIKGPYLWLALHLHVPPTSRPARLRKLEVRYPARSWIEDLPAIYRAEPTRAGELRRFLAVFETVFDDLEERIEKLPERLASPDTEQEQEWDDFLLRWLGLPLPADIPADRKRAFLAQAPALLLRRGTPWALQKALHIVTGREVHIDDLGNRPLPWVLGHDGAGLGDDSLLIRAGQPGFVLGGTARLKRDALGQRDPRATELVARRTQMLRIDIEGRPEEEASLRAGIEATLDHFLPAACRSELQLTRLDSTGQGRHLDRDLRLMDPRIGRTMRLGRSALATDLPPAIRLDDRAPLDGRHRLL